MESYNISYLLLSLNMAFLFLFALKTLLTTSRNPTECQARKVEPRSALQSPYLLFYLLAPDCGFQTHF